MAGFDPSKQKEHGKWETGKRDGDLIVGVYTYGNGVPKVGFNRYYEDRQTGELGIKSGGRLTWDDLMFFESILDEIKETMEGIKC